MKAFNSKEVESANVIQQKHCSHNAKANSKNNSKNAFLCFLLRHPTDFFCSFPKVAHWAIKLSIEKVESANVIMQKKRYSQNAKANLKDNTESA